MLNMDEHEAQEHRRQVLDDQVAITRAAAMISPTLASLLAYGRAELERLAADPPADVDEECPF